jgi:hypothetical protein
MPADESSFSQVRNISNLRPQIPFVTTVFIALLIVVIVWFFRGGSFRLYASLFFGIYHFTKLSWLSIILVSVVQNIFFLPFRFLYERFYLDLKKFEHELKKTKEDEQYFLLNRNVREGNASIIFYAINFVFLFIAFISAGRVFLLEFYRTPISREFLYKFIPYPDYPLQGVVFHFPFFNITKTYAVAWPTILHVWLWVIVFFIVLRLLWRLLKPILSKNAGLLRFRIGYNRLFVIIGGFIGTFLIVTTLLLRNFPTQFHFYYLTANLSHQNTTFNLITAICTFFAAIYSGYQHNREESLEARKAGIPENVIARVGKAYTRNSVRNGLFLGISAFIVTRLMPCSHDLSVLAFEACYVLSPITFDLVIPRSKHRA